MKFSEGYFWCAMVFFFCKCPIVGAILLYIAYEDSK